MQYMLVFREEEEFLSARTDPERSSAYWGAWGAYIAAINEAGVVVKGDGLQPPHTATTVRLRDGRREVQDGPYADTKEQLGGYLVVDVPTLDAAIDWAARAPAASAGSVEVRPVLPPMAPPA